MWASVVGAVLQQVGGGKRRIGADVVAVKGGLALCGRNG